MADNSLKRFVPAKSASGTSPLPAFHLPSMPDKLRQISPELEQWEQSVTETVQQQFRLLEEKLNSVIDAQRTGN